ncbi:MAG: methyltransferase domain-containing protein [Thermodesulfobacteriota bacterium]|nr:MAG: methyltransferase domain-containing protein [Thermodesulfobacteriota bacterium]
MHKFSPEHLERLMSAEREKDLSPERLLRESGLRTGQAFADIGSGPGFFTIPAARIIGPTGMAFAVDTQADMLIYLRDRKNPPDNVILMKSEEYEIPLADFTADFALMAFVLHETVDKSRLLRETRRIMKPGGTLLLLDWEKKAEDKGPPLEERVSAGDARSFVEESGFDVVQSSKLNPSHYRILARRPV